jgi:hypothetical protein
MWILAVTDFTLEDYNFERCEGIDFEGVKSNGYDERGSTRKLWIPGQSKEAV